LASNSSNQATVVLGDEFDDSLRQKLMDVLRKLGALQSSGGDRFVVGSQDLEELEVTIDGRSLRVEAETYVGLSISGPADLVEQVRRLVLQ
jgi:hypothetical protein